MDFLFKAQVSFCANLSRRHISAVSATFASGNRNVFNIFEIFAHISTLVRFYCFFETFFDVDVSSECDGDEGHQDGFGDVSLRYQHGERKGGGRNVTWSAEKRGGTGSRGGKQR